MTASWFRFFSADYLLDAKVADISLECQGILVRLWCLCSRDGVVPNTPKQAALRTMVDPKVMAKHWATLTAFFQPCPGGMYSKRMASEAKHYEEKCDKLRANAQAGGKASGRARTKQMLEQNRSKCSSKIEANVNGIEQNRTEHLSLGETDGLAALKAVWPKARINGVTQEIYNDTLATGISPAALVQAAEAFVADPAAFSAPRFAPSLGIWLKERRFEPYLGMPAEEGPYTLAPDPLAVS